MSEDRTRLDQWLWAARLFKTRSLAKTAVEGGKVHVNGQRVKAAKEVAIGQTITISRAPFVIELVVDGLARRRGSATVAQTLYSETNESIEARETLRSVRRMQNAGLQVPRNRPNKRDRRALAQLKQNNEDG